MRIFRLLAVVLSLVLAASCNGVKENESSSSAEVTAPDAPEVPAAPAGPDAMPAEKFVGRWQRTDGGYVLEIKSLTPDGKLEAGYFNPNPINVGRAAWQNDGGRLMVMVELSDVNYPGSLYSLEYKAQGDMMVGTYFQAVEKQTYQVEFSRIK